MMCLMGFACLQERKLLKSIKPRIIYTDKYRIPYSLDFPYATKYYGMPEIRGYTPIEVWNKFLDFLRVKF